MKKNSKDSNFKLTQKGKTFQCCRLLIQFLPSRPTFELFSESRLLFQYLLCTLMRTRERIDNETDFSTCVRLSPQDIPLIDVSNFIASALRCFSSNQYWTLQKINIGDKSASSCLRLRSWVHGFRMMRKAFLAHNVIDISANGSLDNFA